MAIKPQSLIPASYIMLVFCSFFSASLSADIHAATEDRLAIAAMLAQYSYHWDSKDSSGFADLFTFDAVMERWREGTLVENSRTVGKEAIHQYAKRSHEGRLADRQVAGHQRTRRPSAL